MVTVLVANTGLCVASGSVATGGFASSFFAAGALGFSAEVSGFGASAARTDAASASVRKRFEALVSIRVLLWTEAIHVAVVTTDHDFSIDCRRRTADGLADFVRPNFFPVSQRNHV